MRQITSLETMKLLVGILFVRFLISQVSSEVEKLIQANNEFALKLHKLLSPSENAFHSPASIFIALGMLYRGARGCTAQEMRDALGYYVTTVNEEAIHQEFAELLITFGIPSDEYKLQIANAIVSSSSYPISEEYKDSLRIYYRAKIKEVNFITEKTKALEEINSWVSEKTKGKIPELLDDLDDDTVMVLLNAVYFKGTWKTEFNAGNTKDDVFYSHGRNGNDVRMMREDNYFFYRRFWEQNFHCLKLPYKGEDISMIILLPFDNNGLRDLEETLTSQKLIEIISALKKQKVRVAIPKFKLEDSRKLNESLKQLGMREAFQEGAANFRGIDKSRRLYVSEVVHKAMVEINEEGSEAAAGTAVIANARSGLLSEEFWANHPFLFLIYHEKIKMILFMGRVNQL